MDSIQDLAFERLGIRRIAALSENSNRPTFLGKDDDGHLFVFVRLSKGAVEFFGVGVSSLVVSLLNKKAFALQDCFLRNNDALLFCCINHEGVKRIPSLEEAKQIMASDPWFSFRTFSDALPSDYHGIGLQSLSVGSNSINIVIDDREVCEQRISVQSLRNLLKDFSDVFDFFGGNSLGDDLLFSLNPAGSLVASFSTRNKTENSENEMAMADVQKAFETLKDADAAAVSEVVKNDPEGVKKLHKFTESISAVSSQSVPEVIFCNRADGGMAKYPMDPATSEAFQQTLEQTGDKIGKELKSEIIHINGKLDGAFIHGSRRFVFIGDQVGALGLKQLRYSGTIEKSFSERIDSLIVKGQNYRATILGSFYLVDGRHLHETYQLQDLTPLKGSQYSFDPLVP